LGVRSTLPVEDIVLLFGIDLAGDKAIMDPIIFVPPTTTCPETKSDFELM
jgi:hypothetical protein